ncbi:CoA transferase [Pacificimonas sp. WHA3]|uniref:CoA transferase n=2 Tax=Pacificimonas pallii TaxID=2827236 RepID=A0ABS6SC58_9SPHN|nr:CoA transferase [Pacificimonas pallii]MBV7255810.1 CoA transferase [Pacificimonas pallii]
MSSDAHGALRGLRLIEMGQLIAGPFCGQLMADHGAEVIKIEPPGTGDPMRGWGQGIPLWWSVVARNKKCITVNLREAEGQDIVRRLAEKSDFLLENFRPGTMEKWSLGWESLHELNRRLIMIRVSGFGQTGPYAKRAGYGSIGEAMGGMRYLAGDPSTPPSRVGLSIGDSLAATYACLGAMMALHHRERTGEGQMVDAAIYEAVLAMMESTVAEFTVGGIIRERTGSILPGIAPSNIYPAKDGEILIGANQDSVWARMSQAMGKPELAADDRFRDHVSRGRNQAELDDMISAWTATFDTENLLGLLERAGVPAGRIYKAPDMLQDPQFLARDALQTVPHPEHENLVMQAPAPRLSATPGSIRWPGPPELGQHNEEILGELLGMDSAARADLSDRGII